MTLWLLFRLTTSKNSNSWLPPLPVLVFALTSCGWCCCCLGESISGIVRQLLFESLSVDVVAVSDNRLFGTPPGENLLLFSNDFFKRFENGISSLKLVSLAVEFALLFGVGGNGSENAGILTGFGWDWGVPEAKSVCEFCNVALLINSNKAKVRKDQTSERIGTYFQLTYSIE